MGPLMALASVLGRGSVVVYDSLFIVAPIFCGVLVYKSVLLL